MTTTRKTKGIAEILDRLSEPIVETNEADAEMLAVELGELGQAALPAICDLLASNNVDQRFWAVRALWANGSAAAQDYLIGLLSDSDEMIRSAAALAIGELKARNAIPSLAQVVTSDESPAGNHAADALSKIGLPAQDTLIEMLQDSRILVRVRAAKALVPIESKAAIRPLIQALDYDESYLVRYYAGEALKRMGVGQMIYFK